MSSNFEIAVDNFLNQFGQLILRRNTLKRIWKAFMAYSMCLVAEAFRNKGYIVRPENHLHAFVFKCFPAGDPRNYSYFTAQKGKEQYEIRLNTNAKNLRYSGLKLNLDIVVITPNSINNYGTVDSEQDLITFLECKNLRGFPELVASFQGMVYELQRSRLNKNSLDTYPIPSCLLLSSSGHSILHVNSRYVNRRMSMRIFDSIQPNNPSTRIFIRTWF